LDGLGEVLQNGIPFAKARAMALIDNNQAKKVLWDTLEERRIAIVGIKCLVEGKV
jgi:hypothetical protein